MSKFVRILFVRHGEMDTNNEGVIVNNLEESLNDVGRGQARKTGLKLKDEPIDFVFTSDYKRAQQTARIIAGENDHFNATEREILIGGKLAERHFGESNQGMSFRDYGAKAMAAGHQRSVVSMTQFNLPGAETADEMKLRVRRALRALINYAQKKSEDEKETATILAATHSGFLIMLGVVLEERHKCDMSGYMGPTMRIPPNCCIVEVLYNVKKNRFFCKQYAETDHLED